MITSQLDPYESHSVVQRDISNAIENLAELPASRERSLALTKLEEAALWLDQIPAETRQKATG